MKDFIKTISDWKFDLVYGSIGASVSVVSQEIIKDMIHLWWVLIAAFLSPIAAYFGKKLLELIKTKFNLK